MTTTTRATARWTKGFKKVATILAVGGLALTTIMIGGVAFAPAANACTRYDCLTTTVTHRASGSFCDYSTGGQVTVPWSATVTTGTFHVENNSTGVYTYQVGYPACPNDEGQAKAATETATDWTTLMGQAKAAAVTAAAEEGQFEGACPVLYTCTPAVAREQVRDQFCDVDGVTQWVDGYGSTGESEEFTYPVVSSTGGLPLDKVGCAYATEQLAQSAADAEALDNALADMAAHAEGMTPGACAVTVSWVGEAATNGSAEYCTVEGTTVTLAYSGVGRSSSTTSQADATYQAQLIADREAQADLLSVTPTGAIPGACPAAGVVEPAVAEPAVVAPVEAATVAAPEPAKVQVPAAATPLPASIPAGDGSSIQQQPVALLALLVLAAAVAVTSGLRMATNR